MSGSDWSADTEAARTVQCLLNSDMLCKSVEREAKALCEQGRYLDALELINSSVESGGSVPPS
jgi:hypothetical protein